MMGCENHKCSYFQFTGLPNPNMGWVKLSFKGVEMMELGEIKSASGKVRKSGPKKHEAGGIAKPKPSGPVDFSGLENKFRVKKERKRNKK